MNVVDAQLGARMTLRRLSHTGGLAALALLASSCGTQKPPSPKPAPPPAECLVSISAFDPKTGAALAPPYQVAAGAQIQFVANFTPCP